MCHGICAHDQAINTKKRQTLPVVTALASPGTGFSFTVTAESMSSSTVSIYTGMVTFTRKQAASKGRLCWSQYSGLGYREGA
jgi:hypothetical protein